MDPYSIELNDNNFESGNLNKISNIRPNRIFTADKKILLYKIGHLKKEKITETIDKIISILEK